MLGSGTMTVVFMVGTIFLGLMTSQVSRSCLLLLTHLFQGLKGHYLGGRVGSVVLFRVHQNESGLGWNSRDCRVLGNPVLYEHIRSFSVLGNFSTAGLL